MPWSPLNGEAFPSLGWHVADQMAEFLAAPDRAEYEPFMVSREQLEFLVRMYELDPATGKRIKHRAVLQRPRGWGKSPFLAAIGISEALFEVNCDGWDAQGQPVAVPWSRFITPHVAITAVAEAQIKNTWDPLLEMLRNGPAVDEFDVNPMDTFVALPRGSIEKMTSSARSAKGYRAVAAILDQTEEWVKSNGGISFAQVLRNNATKLGGITLESPNAFIPGEGSVAEGSAAFWDQIRAGKTRQVGDDRVRSLLYDNREGYPDTDLANMESLVRGLRYAYGDSSDHADGCVLHSPPCAPGWSPIGRIALDFWDTSNDTAVMRADFLNQTTGAVDSWVGDVEWRAIGPLENDEPPMPKRGDTITVGFDGSEGRVRGKADATALIGCRVSDGLLFELGIWEQPDGPAGEGWTPPMSEIEATVADTFKTYNVIGMYCDPAAKWTGRIDQWEGRYLSALKIRGHVSGHPMYWWMSGKRGVAVAEAINRLYQAIVNKEIRHLGERRLTNHVLNARRRLGAQGIQIHKEHPESENKIDAAVAAVLAYTARQDAVAKGIGQKKKSTASRIY